MIRSFFDFIVNPAKINYTCLCLNCGLKLRVFRMAFEVLSWQHLSFQVICEHTFRFWTPLCIFALGHWSCHIILIKYQILCWYEKVTLLFTSFYLYNNIHITSRVIRTFHHHCNQFMNFITKFYSLPRLIFWDNICSIFLGTADKWRCLAVNINCFELRNLVMNTKQTFLDRHSLHVKLHQWIRRWKIKQYINHICRAIIVYTLLQVNLKCQIAIHTYFLCFVLNYNNSQLYVFRTPWLEENKRKWTWNYYWIAH